MMRRSNSNPERKRAESRGRFAEIIAVWYLRAKFFSIQRTRFKTPVGEVDIIAKRGKLTIFVEVKMRASVQDKLTALESVNQRRIIRAANFYVAQNPHLAETPLRFDVIFLTPFAWPLHLQAAFEAR